MTRYYRVRSQEQWEWLMEHLELEYPFSSTTFLTDSIFMDLKDGQQLVPKISIKSSNINKIIEVSKLMEDEKMENDYVTIDIKDFDKIKDEDGQEAEILESEILVPTSLLYPKVKMTEEEKKEFDELKYGSKTLITGVTKLGEFGADYPFLCEWLTDSNQAQLEFARAWADPSLIEVVTEPKFNVKVPVSKGRDYYEKYSTVKEDNLVIVGTLDSLRELLTNTKFQFTGAELKQYGLDSDMYEKVEVKE